jgi:hypothetical protein
MSEPTGRGYTPVNGVEMYGERYGGRHSFSSTGLSVSSAR